MSYDYIVVDSKVDEETDRFSFAVVIRDNPRYEGKILAFRDFKMDEDEKGDLFVNTQMLIVNSDDKVEVDIQPEDHEYMEGLMQYMLSDLLKKFVDKEITV